ncbi:hypothetical protein CF326_g2166 [Tilletia indica]|uniref:Small ribosomal subunit protein uS10 domain-containing protein n=1 Tax=Tilletia indica TaxID=43049 RepID=A0A177TUN4_9BASI|nr:hypothetical protein CF326_g2166 [Tilletia indica]KAE8257256.1 hypothetical protein A4X13_0g2477 [Tilletia indica]
MNVSRTAISLARRTAASETAASFRSLSRVGPSRWISSTALRTQAQEAAASTSSESNRQAPPPSTSSEHSPTQSPAQGAGREQNVQSSGDKFVPPPIPQTFEELRYFQPPESAPLTHGVHVATLSLWTYGPTLHNLENFSIFALRVMGSLGIPHSGIARLPTRTSLWTVPKSPFVHKKAQENFERRTHRRAIKMWDANPEVVDRCLAFLREHSMAEVHSKAQLFRYVDLPSTSDSEVPKALEPATPTSDTTATAASTADSDSAPQATAEKP